MLLACSQGSLVQIDRLAIAGVIRRQLRDTSPAWRHYWQARNLASYVPIPQDQSVAERLNEDSTSYWYHFRKFVARTFKLSSPKPKRSFYSEDKNGEVVKHISLGDLSGTDLHALIGEIAARARDLVRE